MLKQFRFSAIIALATVAAVLVTLGVSAALTTIVLIAIEIAFSFDNAIVNAKVLAKLSRFWQQLFLTVGVLIAIVGMRFVFPVVIVMVSAHLSWGEVIHEALHNPAAYANHLSAAQPTIDAFGGGFLLTLALYFLFDDKRDELWLEHVEKPLQKIGGPIWLPPLVAAGVVALVYLKAADTAVLTWGLAGVASYMLLKLLIDGMARLEPQKSKQYTGWAAFLAFMYLQVLDAGFSFDSVLGAFAITDKIVLIAIGLGVGALWVRSLTVVMVRRGTLKNYIYLEHGAHYAILMLAAALLIGIFFDIPNAVTGIAGLGIIGASFVESREVLKGRT
ncbi:MAG TPA: DUF475 domain-containing protein [Candidatus Saccharimonadia bacterium]|nr:DUF475 domain-containing protein [Candidatus Saccharimonadia bacterium]